MTQHALAIGHEAGAAVHAVVVAGGDRRGGVRVARQLREEGLEALGLEGQHRRELPEDGAELVLQLEDAVGEEVGQRRLDLLEPAHVGDVLRPLDGEDESGGGVLVPLGVVLGALQRVERAVDLDRGKHARGVLQLLRLRQLLGVEHATPRFVAPAGDADADVACHAAGAASDVPSRPRRPLKASRLPCPLSATPPRAAASSPSCDAPPPRSCRSHRARTTSP